MITAIEIENLRGIARGKLEGLTPLTILTGPNGCGKSTVLDALLIGGDGDAANAVGHSVKRRPETHDGARWLIRRGRDTAKIYTAIDGTAQTTVVRNSTQNQTSAHLDVLRGDGIAHILFDYDNQYRCLPGSIIAGRMQIRLIDPGLVNPLTKSFSEATRNGRRTEAYALLAELVPGFESLDILTEADGTPALYLTLKGRGGAIPVGLTGDGIQSFLELALELAAIGNGVGLIEEPEVYQHPRAIRNTARVLLAAARRDVQVVLSTHSLELIDALVDAATDTDLANLSLFNLDLRDGELRSSRYSGSDIAFNRTEIANDLR